MHGCAPALTANVPESAPRPCRGEIEICLGGLMSSLRLLMSVLFGTVILAGCAAEAGPPAAMAAAAANPVTGEGLPNPNPTRIGSWATLPEGREWGLHRRPRHRPNGRPCLGVRALRIGLGGWTRGQLRQQPRGPDLQVRPQYRGDPRQLRRRNFRDAPRHLRGRRGHRLGDGLCGQRGGHQGSPGPQVQLNRRAASEPRYRRAAWEWPGSPQPAQ